MTFPTLISGELVQSSAIRSESAMYIEHFFEGYSRQTHHTADHDQRSWRLKYRNLHPDEAMLLRSFYEALPVGGQFSFTDPWTGVVFPNCRLADTRLGLSCDKDNRFSAQLEIENAD